ncbi:hypothetical protein D9615_010325 [Tricholomella constricta]|uniref:SH3 domain-containing protein n=1 Tax=Tricholomella constricta TaxID=117010 RepID=A0A8H5LTD6_9AGAR|nr:hypothetical protein D9615_010325 [Tricholomella constricta]
MAMEAAELARWTRFAAKGGIGKCTAICDCVAENADDLMFLKDDEITVLMQLTEPQGVYLGYCEGVVGRFSGSNVHFHSKLKKPVMAKRSSVTAQSQGKSPTPPHGFKAPSPMPSDSPVPSLSGSRRTRVSLDKHVSASISSFVSSDQVPVVGPLGRSRASYGSSRSRSSIRQEQSDGESAREKERVSSPPQAALSHAPSLVSSPSTSTTGTLVDGSSPNSITRTSLLQTSPPRTAYSSPSYNSSRHASLLSSYSQATFNEDDADSTYHAENTTSTASPRPEPTSPPSSPLTAITTTPNASTRLPSPPSSTPLDTSTSTRFDDNSRISLALSDGEVGIGLSLLQDLAEGGSYDGWSDSDSDEQVMGRRESVRRVGSKRRGSALGSRVAGLRAGDTTRLGVWRKSIRESVISEGSKYSNSSEGDSDSGLGYEDTETGHGARTGTGTGTLDAEDELEADITQTQRAFLNLDATPAPSSSFTNRNSSPRSPPPSSPPRLPNSSPSHPSPRSPPPAPASSPRTPFPSRSRSHCSRPKSKAPPKAKTTNTSSRLPPHTPRASRNTPLPAAPSP